MLTSEMISAVKTTRTSSSSLIRNHHNEEEYDYILDKGLMNSIINSIEVAVVPTSDNNQCHSSSKQQGKKVMTRSNKIMELHVLLNEASQCINEHGIYVMITDKFVSQEVKEYLSGVGDTLGMEWKFDLDGISSAENGISISVARKYFNNALPSSFNKDEFVSMTDNNSNNISSKNNNNRQLMP